MIGGVKCGMHLGSPILVLVCCPFKKKKSKEKAIKSFGAFYYQGYSIV